MSFYIKDNEELKEVPMGKVETLMNNGINVLSDKDIIIQLKQQLSEAVEVIEFYGKRACFETSLIDEFNMCNFFAWNEDGEEDCGKRARQFLAKYRGEK